MQSKGMLQKFKLLLAGGGHQPGQSAVGGVRTARSNKLKTTI